MKKITLIILLLFLAAFTAGCSGGGAGLTSGTSGNSSSSPGSGNLKFSFTWPTQQANKAKYLSSGTSSFSISITGEGLNSASVTNVAYGTRTVTVENLPVGSKVVILSALNSGGSVLSKGRQTFVIEKEKTVAVNITLGVVFTDNAIEPSTITVPQNTWVYFYNAGTMTHSFTGSSEFTIPGEIRAGGSIGIFFSDTGTHSYNLDNPDRGISGSVVVTPYTGPAISSFSPSTGALPGQSLTINGTGFGALQGNSSVTIGTATAVITSWSDTVIVCTMPSTAIGTSIPIIVTVNYQASTTNYYANSAPANTDVPAFDISFGGSGIGDGQFQTIFGIVTYGNYINVVDSTNARVQRFVLTNFDGKWGSLGAANGQFNQPFGVAVNSTGRIFISDTANNRIQMFNASGNFLGKLSTPGLFNQPRGIAIDGSDNLYVVDRGNTRVLKFDSNLNLLTTIGYSGSTDGRFNSPYAIAIDSSGNLFVTDNGNSRIQKFDSNGTFLLKWGSKGALNGQFQIDTEPYGSGISVDPSGNVYVADKGNNRIQKFSGTTGNYLGKFTVGDPVLEFNAPTTVYVDGNYVVYAADAQNRVKIFRYGGGK